MRGGLWRVNSTLCGETRKQAKKPAFAPEGLLESGLFFILN